MKTKMIYRLYVDGILRGKTSVTVNVNASAYAEAEERLNKRFDVLAFNHAGKTVTLRGL